MGNMDDDDPWDWSVDRVVRELCTSDRSWQVPRSTATPDPTVLENILREHGVTGTILLLDIDDNALRADFKFRTLSQRSFIRRAIEELQLQSAQWQTHIDRRNNRRISASLHSPATNGVNRSSSLPRSNNALAFEQPCAIGQNTAAAAAFQVDAHSSMSLLGSPQPANSSEKRSRDKQDGHLLTRDRVARGEYIVTDELGNKRRKLSLINASNDLSREVGDGRPLLPTQSNIELPSYTECSSTGMPTSEPAINHHPSPSEKMPKRIAPTLVSPNVDSCRDRQIATAADKISHTSLENIKPSMPFIPQDRHDLIDRQVPDPEHLYNNGDVSQRPGLPKKPLFDKVSSQDLGVKVHRTRNDRLKCSGFSLAGSYLGKKKMSVDAIFYEGAAVGQELPSAEIKDDVSLCHKMVPSGQRLYVNQRMKEFLRSELTAFERDGISYHAIRPYPSKLIEKFYSPSFTLFYVNEYGKACSRREEIMQWPEIDSNISSQLIRKRDESGRAGYDFGILGEVGSYEKAFDPDCLIKYQHILGGDEVLPVYGESDEENEYDVATWAEIEEERGAIEKPFRPLDKPAIPAEDVDQAIDEGIAEIVAKWQSVKLPKLLKNAYRIWKKFDTSHDSRRIHIEGIQKLLDRINDDRIPKLRKEIASVLWSSKRQVLKQSRIMEQSIYDRESSVWEMELLQSSVAPEKALSKDTPSISSKLRRKVQNCEEIELIGSDSKASSSDEDVGDFIVDDTPSDTEEVEMNFADTENEEHGSSGSNPSTSRKKTPENRLTSKDPCTAKLSSKDDTIFDEPNDASESTRRTDTTPRKKVIHRSPAPSQSIKHNSTQADALPQTLNTADNPIDLTLLSSDDGPDTPTIDLVTPKKTKLKLIHKRRPFGESSVPASDAELALPDLDNLPLYNDPDAISRFSHEAWATICDRERLLISVFKGFRDELKAYMFSFVSSVSEAELWCHMLDVMGALLCGEGDDRKGTDKTTFQAVTGYIQLFNIYTSCKYHHGKKHLASTCLTELPKRTAYVAAFYRLCQNLEGYFSKPASMLHLSNGGNRDSYGVDGDDSESVAKRQQAVNATSDENDIQQHNSQHKKRKRKVNEDKAARAMREKDRERLEQQEARRKKLQEKLPSLEYAEGQHRIVVNDGKYENQGFVYVNKKIAPRIKQHQIEGLRFMWSQIVTDQEDMQGCLLAHTMGLGKTMQVITLLCAIAESSKSDNTSVSAQIPASLRTSKTIILCPAGLIDNWMDELLIWAPEGLLGEYRKVDTTMKWPERLQTISDWFYEGGVLMLGYEMFRSIYDNKSALGKEAHDTVKRQLMDGPNIIVADEAHKMKNAQSRLGQSTTQFKSRSRIALTGSPLANNVEEYHTMINWVAPNYLGPALEFRAKYVEPIEEGLWHDSSASDRRRSLKMLGVLRQELAPKVHRADMSVLRNDLPPKKEFVIIVPLTELQRKLYSLYVRSMVSGTTQMTKDGEFTQTTLWHWLAILSLLCNHPVCFSRKLNERKEDAGKGRHLLKPPIAVQPDSDQENGVATDLNESTGRAGVSQELINKIAEIFKQEANDLVAIDLSNKVKVLCQILDASKAAGDKVLVFSQSLLTLNFLEDLCTRQRRRYFRLDGSTPIAKRQEATKAFNLDNTEIYLISTAAGGLGLNIFGANRVVIFDFKFNPIMEEQAVGRAYRIGQKKSVFVYRFVAGGTFEDSVHNKAVFKTQLASRVVDKKNPVAWARKRLGDMLFEPKDVEQKDLSEFIGMDPLVLDTILASQTECSTVRGIVQTDTFERDDNDKLTAEEEREVRQLVDDQKLKRSNPKAFYELMQQRKEDERNRNMELSQKLLNVQTNAAPTTQSATPAPAETSVSAKSAEDKLQQTSSISGKEVAAAATATGRTTADNSAALMKLATIKLPPPQTERNGPGRAPTSSCTQSPVARAQALLRSATPEGSSAASFRMDLPRRSASPAIKNVIPPHHVDSKIASVSKAYHDHESMQNMPEDLETAQQEIEAVLSEAIKQLDESANPTITSNLHQLSLSIQKAITEATTGSGMKALLEATLVDLKSDKAKCQALVTSAISPVDSVRDVLQSISKKTSTTGEVESTEQVCPKPIPASNPAPSNSSLLVSSSEKVAEAKELQVAQPQHKRSDSATQRNQALAADHQSTNLESTSSDGKAPVSTNRQL